MARLKTGEYQVTYFDKYGEKQRNADRPQELSFIRARLTGEEAIKTGKYDSFMITRSVFNSLDQEVKH